MPELFQEGVLRETFFGSAFVLGKLVKQQIFFFCTAFFESGDEGVLELFEERVLREALLLVRLRVLVVLAFELAPGFACIRQVCE